ncbi:transcriptional regulator [Thermococcus paralvinellae]|uniref:Transcriptional regulator, ArsR family n=1 Tax=Thermococcus paralvinellae TaxID=582419 RepID=W0I5A5_9EURY|nr:transcriptional regulator [Thermococcus paralvinellae]AHF81249.1 Transcriptional regulator, ArsR family [Thermococcus paralvinellae]
MELRKLVKNHVLGNPIRLGIMLYLLPRGKVLFKELQKVLDVTPGNLDSHLKTLEKAGYVKLTKVFADRPRTAVEITDNGAEETGKYLRMLKELLNQI